MTLPTGSRSGAWRRTALVAVVSLLLVGCGSDGGTGGDRDTDDVVVYDRRGSSEEEATTAPAAGTSSPTPEATGTTPPSEAAPTTAEPATPVCGEETATSALDRWISEVPPFFPGIDPHDRDAHGAWSAEFADTAGYDPCADLSWIVLPVTGGTVSSPYAVMLFHRGEFVGPATEESYGFGHDVERVADDTITITYRYVQPGEANADASGRATSTFTWDAGAGEVVRTGELPPR